MIYELRWALAYKLLDWALAIVPNGKAKMRFAKYLRLAVEETLL